MVSEYFSSFVKKKDSFLSSEFYNNSTYVYVFSVPLLKTLLSVSLFCRANISFTYGLI